MQDSDSPSEEREVLGFQLVLEIRLVVGVARLLVLIAAVEASDCVSLSGCRTECSLMFSSCLLVRGENDSGIKMALACQLRVGSRSLELCGIEGFLKSPLVRSDRSVLLLPSSEPTAMAATASPKTQTRQVRLTQCLPELCISGEAVLVALLLSSEELLHDTQLTSVHTQGLQLTQ